MKRETFKQLETTSSDWRSAGTVFVVAGLVWFVLEAIAASQFPAYSYAVNYISDLGAPDVGVFEGRHLDSPLSLLANFMFVTQGMAFLAAAALVVRSAAAGTGRRVFMTAAVGYAIGYAMIGSFHGSAQAAANGTFPLHVVGGSLAVISGYTAVIAAGLLVHHVHQSAGFRTFSLGVGAIGIVSLAWLMVNKATGTMHVLPDGLLERGGCYAIILWEIVTGALLLAASKSPRAAA